MTKSLQASLSIFMIKVIYLQFVIAERTPQLSYIPTYTLITYNSKIFLYFIKLKYNKSDTKYKVSLDLNDV